MIDVIKILNTKNLIIIGIIILALALRTYHLDTIPPSLNWDEAATAWNGYSIGKTHLDEYGTKFPLTFRSFGDYKAPGLIYLTAIVTRLFGLSIWTIRLPIALIGTATVLVMYLLAKEISDILNLSRKQAELFSILTIFLTAVNPWHIFFSRGAFETTLALFLTTFGIWIFILSLKYILLLPFSLFFFLGAMYSYHSPKIFLPIFGLVLIKLYGNQIINNIINTKWTKVILLFGFGLLIWATIPLVKVSIFEKGSGRLDTSIFYTAENTPLPLNHNIAIQFMKNYVIHLDPRFLLMGERMGNFRTELKNSGKITLIEYIFLLIGLFYLVKEKNKHKVLLISWLLIAIVPAAIGKEVPHGIRSLALFPVVILIISLGIIRSLKWLKQHRLIAIILAGFFAVQFGIFKYDYFLQFPVYGANDWQYGIQQVAKFAKDNENSVDKILITNVYGQPHVLTYVYQKQDPLNVIYGGMGKYQFREISWEGDQFCKKCLLIGTDKEIPNDFPANVGNHVNTIYFPNGEVAFKIVKTY